MVLHKLSNFKARLVSVLNAGPKEIVDVFFSPPWIRTCISPVFLFVTMCDSVMDELILSIRKDMVLGRLDVGSL